jgi:hypothetical protein
MSKIPAATKPAKVRKIITSSHPEIPEKAEISIDDCDDLHRELRTLLRLKPFRCVECKHRSFRWPTISARFDALRTKLFYERRTTIGSHKRHDPSSQNSWYAGA